MCAAEIIYEFTAVIKHTAIEASGRPAWATFYYYLIIHIFHTDGARVVKFLRRINAETGSTVAALVEVVKSIGRQVNMWWNLMHQLCAMFVWILFHLFRWYKHIEVICLNREPTRQSPVFGTYTRHSHTEHAFEFIFPFQSFVKRKATHRWQTDGFSNMQNCEKIVNPESNGKEREREFIAFLTINKALLMSQRLPLKILAKVIFHSIACRRIVHGKLCLFLCYSMVDSNWRRSNHFTVLQSELGVFDRLVPRPSYYNLQLKSVLFFFSFVN